MGRGLAAALAAILLAGCGGGDAASSAGSASGVKASQSAAPAELGTLKESGFGQEGQYAWVTSVVHNNSAYVGQTITVSFNALDSQGEILATESQVESFDRPDADHIIGTQVDVGAGSKVAKVEASLDVEAAGAFSDKPFPEVPLSKLTLSKSEFGGRQVTFQVTNPLTQAIKSPRIQVLCRSKSGAITGGGSAYPELLPGSGRIKVQVDLITSAAPASCTARVGAPSDWDGTDAAAAAPSQDTAAAAPTQSAEAAFKTWVDQFTAKDWDSQYATLLSAQQGLISEKTYRKCRTTATPAISWVKTLSVQDAGNYSVPGTSLKLPATKVTAQVTSDGVKVPVDAHMFLEDGRWKWTMTSENLKGCRG